MVEVKRILAPGGVALIISPNEGALSNQLQVVLGKRKTQEYGTLRPPYHLHAFAPSTLKRLLKRAGFEKCLVKTATLMDPIVALGNRKDTWSLRRDIVFGLLLGARMLGRGSLLVGWAAKDTES